MFLVIVCAFLQIGAGRVRLLGHISTDKPVYKPNDMMFIEVYAFDPVTKGPGDFGAGSPEWNLDATLEILDTFGNSIETNAAVQGKSGTIAFTYKIPKDAKGGEYKVKVTSQ